MKNLTFKNVKATEKLHSTISVFSDNVYIGYITSPKVNIVSGKWHFSGLAFNCNAKTKKELINLIEN